MDVTYRERRVKAARWLAHSCDRALPASLSLGKQAGSLHAGREKLRHHGQRLREGCRGDFF